MIKGTTNNQQWERKFDQEPEIVAKDKEVLRMNVQTPKVMLGIKAINVNQLGLQLLKRELATNIYLKRNLLFGKSSPLHEELYEGRG